jgi:hypothetical protein
LEEKYPFVSVCPLGIPGEGTLLLPKGRKKDIWHEAKPIFEAKPPLDLSVPGCGMTNNLVNHTHNT